MILELIRHNNNAFSTGGFIRDPIDNNVICYTLEPPLKGNVHCIDEGEYPCTIYRSPRLKYDVYLLSNVKGHDFIEIHIGNKVADTRGCILPGLVSDLTAGTVMASGTALKKLMAYTNKQPFTLIVKSV